MKKITSFILAFVLFAMPLCIEAYAAETDVNYDDQIMPCYTYLSSISAGISAGSLGFANCISNIDSFQADKTFVLTCSLQRCTASDPWTVYKSKTETFSGKGSFTIDKSWFAPSNYDYRVVTSVSIKNSSGTVVETASKASGILYK